MTSLVPGSLFSSAGFNRKSTPTPPHITPEELQNRYKRARYNGRPWPQSSPTAGVYDIGFTSTKLILYNNQRKRQNCKLRGRNDPAQETDIYPDPGRHSRCSTPVHDNHKKCYDSSSPYYVAKRVGNLDWANYGTPSTGRFTFEDGSMVNPKHHTSCLVPSVPHAYRLGIDSASVRRPSSRASLPPNFRSSPLLTHKDLGKGEKQYLYSIAKIYSASQMIQLKQEQYKDLLTREFDKGLYTEEEYRAYMRYIQIGRDRQYLRTGQRIKSAPAARIYDNRRPGQYPSSVKEEKKETDSDENEDRETEKSEKPPSARSKNSSQRPASTKSVKSTTSARSYTSDKESARKEKTIQSPRKKDEEKKEEEKKEESSDSSESVPTDSDRKIHREGVDRPKSRMGHPPEDTKSMKSQEDSSEQTTSKSESKEDKTETQSTDGGKQSDARDSSDDVPKNYTVNPEDYQETMTTNDSVETRQRRSSTSSNEIEEVEQVNRDPDTLQY